MANQKRNQHGSRGRYAEGCRCLECKDANRRYMNEYRSRKRGGKPVRKYGKLTHGTRSFYVHGCRCPECTRANADYQRVWMRMKYQGIPWTDPAIDDALR